MLYAPVLLEPSAVQNMNSTGHGVIFVKALEFRQEVNKILTTFPPKSCNSSEERPSPLEKFGEQHHYATLAAQPAALPARRRRCCGAAAAGRHDAVAS